MCGSYDSTVRKMCNWPFKLGTKVGFDKRVRTVAPSLDLRAGLRQQLSVPGRAALTWLTLNCYRNLARSQAAARKCANK